MIVHTVAIQKNRTDSKSVELDENLLSIAKTIMAAALRQGLHFEFTTQTVDNGRTVLRYRVAASADKSSADVVGIVHSKEDPALVMNLAIIDGAVVSAITVPGIKEAIVEVGEPKQRIGVVIDHWRHFKNRVIDDSYSSIGRGSETIESQTGYWVGYSDIGAPMITVHDGTPNTSWGDVMAMVYTTNGQNQSAVKVASRSGVRECIPALAAAMDANPPQAPEEETRV